MESLTQAVQKLDDRMKKIPTELFEAEATTDPDKLEEYQSIGLEEISNGHVAVVLMAGGQGSRLGVSYPKGKFKYNL